MYYTVANISDIQHSNHTGGEYIGGQDERRTENMSDCYCVGAEHVVYIVAQEGGMMNNLQLFRMYARFRTVNMQ